ncbi:MAG: penicillin-binding protein activator [Betaproteobacteria bacterium]|nr:penicillin-binding protein activator [Betaproteobacteria bacterium]
MNVRKLFLAISSICALLALPASAADPVRIGVLLPMTGATASGGPPMRQGVDLALDAVGRKVAGREIQLFTEDDASDPVVAVDKARKLVEQNKVDVVIGPLMSNAAAAVASYLKSSGTPWMAVFDNSIDIMKVGSHVFQYTGTLYNMGYYAGTYAAEKGHKTASVIGSDYVAGNDYTEGFIDAFPAKGGNVIQRQRVPIGTMDFGPYITGMRKADVVAFWLLPPSPARFVKQYFDFGLEMPLVAISASNLEEPTLKDLGDRTVGIIGAAHWAQNDQTKINKEFMAAYEKKYGAGSRPRLHVMYSYPVMQVFLEAVKQTGGDTSRDKIAQALQKVKAETPMGRVSFGADRVGITDMYLLQVVKKGNFLTWDVVRKYPQVRGQAPTGR